MLPLSFVVDDPEPTFARPTFSREKLPRNSISHRPNASDIRTTFGGDRQSKHMFSTVRQ
jgi:hypothetical protein